MEPSGTSLRNSPIGGREFHCALRVASGLMGGTSHGTPRSSAFGAKLRSARMEAGLTQQQLAERLGVQRPSISRYEDGSRIPDLETVSRLCDALVLDDQATAELIELARGGDSGPWLAITMREQQLQLEELLARERQAVRIVNVSPLLIPGLLQTSDYARAIMVRARVPADQIETRVAVRVGRREALTRREPAELLALIGESVLRQMIGGPQVMADQLRHLLRMAELPNVDMRIVPGDADWHPALEGPFVLDTLADGAAVVHLETRLSGLFLDEEKYVAPYRDAAEMVLREAMSAAASAELIAREAERIEETIA